MKQTSSSFVFLGLVELTSSYKPPPPRQHLNTFVMWPDPVPCRMGVRLGPLQLRFVSGILEL